MAFLLVLLWGTGEGFLIKAKNLKRCWFNWASRWYQDPWQITRGYKWAMYPAALDKHSFFLSFSDQFYSPQKQPCVHNKTEEHSPKPSVPYSFYKRIRFKSGLLSSIHLSVLNSICKSTFSSFSSLPAVPSLPSRQIIIHWSSSAQFWVFEGPKTSLLGERSCKLISGQPGSESWA